jgi:electron transport complex protein RnfE
MGTGFALLLMTIGAFRELFGQGSLFARMDMLFGGEPVRGIVLADNGWLLLVMPPGAFFSLALAIAAKNVIDGRRKDARTALPRHARTLNR